MCHKILHHKRPKVFPLLDGITESAYAPGRAWISIRKELEDFQSAFTSLEAWFKEVAADQGSQCVQLNRLRLHDILLWCDRRGDRGTAREKGQRFL